MMKKSIYVLSAIMLLIAVACKKEPPLPKVNCNSPTNDLALSKRLIVGSWRLNRAHYFIDTTYMWYAKDTVQHDYWFRANGILEYYKNGKFIDSCRYEIDVMKKYTLFPGDTTINTLWLIHPNPAKSMYLESLVPIRICTDSLYLKYQSFRYDNAGDYYLYRIN